ncbi:MAG: AAA family ATPase, partial [Gemmatimonadaceae bacterium]|nr:AAA family ATPase [Gemmatimonadaceae bacterium]
VISHFLKRQYDGDVDHVSKLVKAYVEREEAKDEGGLLKIPFVDTKPAKAMLSVIKYCHKNGRMGAVLSGSGTGKTTTIRQAIKEDPSILVVTAWARLGAIGVQQELCDALKMSDSGNSRALMKRLKHKLTGKGRCLIIDDAHTLAFGALDAIRYIYDQTGTGVVLCGIPSLARHLSSKSEEYEQLASRVAGRVHELPEFSLDDARLMFEAVMSEKDVDRAIGLLKGDPQTMSSGRRLGNLLEDAGKFASRRGEMMSVGDVEKALRFAA